MNKTYVYIFVMAITTYLIRVLPLAFIRVDIKNKTIRSFLYYIPYVSLSVMTFPAILNIGNHLLSGSIGFIVAIFLAYHRKSLFTVAFFSCITVYFTEWILELPFFL